MTALPVAVTVDGASGRWSVDGVPMILVPQHLLTGVLDTAERRAGVEATAATLREAGRVAARQWCAHQATHQGVAGADLVRHYLEQLSRRGWGRFTVVELDLATGLVDVRVDDSAFAARDGEATNACHPFEGWLEGAVHYAADPTAPAGAVRPVREDRCVAAGADHCRFRSLPD